ncbi:MAG: RluA family pseudouridine synthase [Spirochaetes bacterium]|nr:RluA family pseudouridine synthase [Spirochaetota bacterium]
MIINPVYQDEHLILFDKPQGIATTPGKTPSYCEKLFRNHPDLEKIKGYRNGEGGLLNRLDNETGGLLLFAKSNAAFLFYSQQMKKQKILKNYLAIVDGSPIQKQGKIEFPIAHHGKSKKKMVIVDQTKKYRGLPQQAVTEYQIIRQKNQHFLVKVSITKGVRHQIRIHLAASHMPIIGDKLYHPSKDEQIPHHLLYAYQVIFPLQTNPQVCKKITIKVPFVKQFF